MNEREAFEKWFGSPIKLSRNAGGNYIYAGAHTSYTAWQAACEWQKEKDAGEIEQLKAKLFKADTERGVMFESYDNLQAKLAMCVEALDGAVGGFKCTQIISNYPPSHWSRWAVTALNATEQDVAAWRKEVEAKAIEECEAAKRIEELEIALRVIYTWCNIPENQTYLIMDIQNLAKSTLRMK